MEDQTKTIFKMAEDVAGIKATLQTMANVNEVAMKAMQSASSAHLRINELRDEDLKELKENQTWLWRSFIGGLIAGAIGLFWKVAGK